MRSAIRTPLLHILHIPPSPLGRLGARFRNFQPIYFEHLPKRGQRLRKEVGSCGELFSEAGGLAPVFEGGNGGEENEYTLVGGVSFVYR